MLHKIKKYKDIISYLFFGVCTTIVNIIVYAVCTRGCLFGTTLSTSIAWIFAVVFAYLTNRKWVFRSNANGWKQIFKECFSFFACRFLTGILDVAIMFVFVDKLNFDDIIMKALSNVIVILVNYIASKFLIFQNKTEFE